MSLIDKSKAYKPFNYSWAYEAWQRQQQIHWLPEEVALGEDIKDWKSKLTDNERNFLTQIFRFFTQADIDVASGYTDLYLPKFKPVEVKMMLLSFANMETIHIAAYALLIETIGMPDEEFSKFLNYKQMVEKHEYLSNFSVSNEREILKTLAIYGAFTEGLQLFGSFAMLLNFPRFGKMKGMGQIITWSVRDESLHTESIIKLFNTYAEETGVYDNNLKSAIKEIAREVVSIEDNFIDLAFELGDQQELTAIEVKNYIRYICDWRLKQLNISPIYNIKTYPLPWLRSLLNGVEHANFFETRATEYSKNATLGSWEETWATFDSRRTNNDKLGK